MSEPADGQSPPPAPLGYAVPGIYQRPKPRTPYIGRLAIGCFGYVLVTAGWIALGAIGPVKLAVSGWALMTLALLGFSLYLRIRYGFSGVGVGILISLGVGVVIAVLLVVGVVLLVINICGKNNNLGLRNNVPATTYPSTIPTQPATEPATLPDSLPTTVPAVP